MRSFHRLQRPVWLPYFCALVLVVTMCQPARANPEPVSVEFLPLATRACAVISPDEQMLVSVYTDSTPLTKATRIIGTNVKSPLQFRGQDLITRLCFFQNPEIGKSSDQSAWAKHFGTGKPQSLRAITLDGPVNCTYEKWVTQVGEKVLPLGLLAVSFPKQLPLAGTPLIDADGSIVGLILQPATPTSAYAIPAQAVRRVQRDIVSHQQLVRGWLGISLSTSSAVPRITRVWPESPASNAGLKENDILLKAGEYPTDRYPDAVNALFYTVPGQQTSLEILRENQRISKDLTPVAQRPGG